MPWIIDRDLIADAQAKTGTNANAVGVAGPHGYAGDGSELTCQFRMRDDDGEIYYEGRADAESFDPLDHFGTPNAGVTQIEYQQPDGSWKPL